MSPHNTILICATQFHYANLIVLTTDYYHYGYTYIFCISSHNTIIVGVAYIDCIIHYTEPSLFYHGVQLILPLTHKYLDFTVRCNTCSFILFKVNYALSCNFSILMLLFVFRMILLNRCEKPDLAGWKQGDTWARYEQFKC